MRTLIYNIGQLVTNKGVGEKDGIGVTDDDLTIVDKAEILIEGDKIKFCGPAEMMAGGEPDLLFDAKGGTAIPALVDPHTHAVWAGGRQGEFAKRAAGASYLDIAKSGGGIIASAAATYHASREDLVVAGKKRVALLNGYGAGAVEIKSGYGLTTETEIRMLEAIREIAADTKTRILPTFMGAHAVPKNYYNNTEGYVDLVINEMLPKVAEEKLAIFCDVFVEEGFFDIEQSRKILTAARDLGLKIKLHADEFKPLGGAQLAAELGAISADHLLAVDDAGIKALADAGVTAVCLPGTSLFLGEGRYAPARKMLDAGVRVAIASDLNPGSCYTENLSLILSLACTQLKMTVGEAIAAATYNAAKALGIEDDFGVLMPGKKAGIAIFDEPDAISLPYHMGANMLSSLWIDGEKIIGGDTLNASDLKEKIEAAEKLAEKVKADA